MAANPQLERQATRQRTINGILIPAFPKIFEGLKARLPDRRAVLEEAERELVKWTEQVQVAVNRAILDRDTATVTTTAGGTELSQDIQNALKGTSGDPSDGNRYVTAEDLAAVVQAITDSISPSNQQWPHGIGDPNGFVDAGRGAMYQEFAPGWTNFVRTWIKTTTTGNTGWA